MSASLHSLIPELRPYAHNLLVLAGSAGLQPRITSTYRSHTEQTRLYRRYLAGQNAYPVAPPGTSAHEFGYAFDMMIQSAPGQMESDLADLGGVWEKWGGVWGGRFKDPIHFEYPGFPHKEVESSWLEDVKAAGGFAASLLIPTALTTVSSEQTFQERTRGSLGSRALCGLGFQSFC